MARNRRRSSSTSKDEATTEDGTSAQIPAEMTMNQTQMQLAKVVGLTRASRFYNINDRYLSPPVVLRQVIPFAALRGGFRLASEDSTNDTTVNAFNHTPNGIDGNDYLFPDFTLFADLQANLYEPATPMANNFVDVIWPHYDRLFRSSVKQAGTEVTFNNFIGAISCLIKLQSLMIDVKTYTQLANPIGIDSWDEVSSNFGVCLKLYDKSLERRFDRLKQIADGLPGIAGIVNEVKRIKSPFMAIGGEGALTVPVEFFPNSSYSKFSPSVHISTNLMNEIENIIEILRGDFADVIGAMKRHMPYTLGDLDFTAKLPITVDPFKTDGFLNSDASTLNVSGNEGDPDDVNTIYILQDASGVGFIPNVYTQDASKITFSNRIHTVFPDGIPLLSVMSSSIWVADSDAVDAEFALLTPHIVGKIGIPYYVNTGVGVLTLFSDTDGDTVFSNEAFAHLIRPTLSHSVKIGGSGTLYMPFAKPTTLDFDAVVSGLDWFTGAMFDLPIVTALDTLAQTSFAPVVHPTVAALKSGGQK
jgi:hypothetical protein